MQENKPSPAARLAGALRQLCHYPALVFAGLFLCGMLLLGLVAPDRAISELENKTLTQRPALSRLSVAGLNSYFSACSEYVKDQFFGRDAWIGLQSAAETMVLQKTEMGGVLLGSDGMMFERSYGLLASEERTLPKNIAALQALAARYPGRVNVLLVPAASNFYPDAVPTAAPLLDENEYLDEIAAAVQNAGGQYIDVRDTLSAHSGEYIYYRTDHHWTTLGAYYGYEALCEAFGLTPFSLQAHEAVTVPDFYGTHYSKARTMTAQPDELVYYQLDNPLTVYTVTGAGMPDTGEETGLYALEQLDDYDKYAAFLHGNNGLSRIEGDGEGNILIIKDSYANCFAPFLTANYKYIDVVDFRNYNYGLDALDAANSYDEILVLYSFDSFKSDPYFYRAGVAG